MGILSRYYQEENGRKLGDFSKIPQLLIGPSEIQTQICVCVCVGGCALNFEITSYQVLVMSIMVSWTL